MTAFLITYAVAGFLTASVHLYQQLYLSNNWPPSNWRSVSWAAVAMVIGICLVLWPAAWPLMWIDNSHINRQQKTNSTLKRKQP